MNLIKPLATTFILVLAVNAANAAVIQNWCGYQKNAQPISSTVDKRTKYGTMGSSIQAAAANCNPIPACQTALGEQLVSAANACSTAAKSITPSNVGQASAIIASGALCDEYYGYVSTQAMPSQLSQYSNAPTKPPIPFCDGTFSNDLTCQCIQAYGSVESSNPGGTKNMIGYGPYSCLAPADINVYKAKAKAQVNYVLGLGSNSNNYSTLTGNAISATPAQCCAQVGGTVSADGSHCQ